jgi:hypothetical protein
MITRTAIATAVVLAATAAPAWAAAPANDDWEHAASLGPAPVTVDGTLAGATAQADDAGVNVWYAYRPSTSGEVAVELPRHEGYVEGPPTVYTGAARDSLRYLPVRRDQWYGRTRFDAVAGQTYWIEVRGDGAAGDFTLSVHPVAAPANDAFADARRVSVPRLVHGNLEDGTVELGEKGVRDGSSSVWFTIRPKHTGRLTVDGSGSSCWPTVGAFTGSTVSTLHRVSEAAKVVRFTGQRGRTYHLRLTCANGETGAYELDVSDGSIAGKGVTMKARPGQSVGSVRRHGLRIDVGARRKVGVDIDLLVSKATARHLHLRGTTLGHVRGTLGYHQQAPATIRLSSAARRALAGRSHLSATLRLTLRDHAPNRVLTVRVGL